MHRAFTSDPTRLRQILINLIGNAVKFTHDGVVTVRVRRGETDAQSPHLCFDVIDTGIGIDASVIDRLFDEFTQADSTISRRYEGTGLGLAISRKLVKTMGGEIGVDSTLGEGSVFHFWLPLQEASGPVIDGNKTAHIAAFKTLRPLRVLIAEDNQINHMIIGALMKKYGHTFVIAENGNEAVIALQQAPFDLALLDIRMPEMSGPEAARAIRKMPAPAGDIPIIALTADAMRDHLQAYLDSGMNAITAKPIDQTVLLLSINDVMGETIHQPLDEAGRPIDMPRREVADDDDAVVKSVAALLQSFNETDTVKGSRACPLAT